MNIDEPEALRKMREEREARETREAVEGKVCLMDEATECVQSAECRSLFVLVIHYVLSGSRLWRRMLCLRMPDAAARRATSCQAQTCGENHRWNHLTRSRNLEHLVCAMSHF
jgi:hypothetical protein